MGNNDRHFWRSNGQLKIFKEQGSFSLRHIMVKVGLLVGNKGILNLRAILTPREQRKAEKPRSKVHISTGYTPSTRI